MKRSFLFVVGFLVSATGFGTWRVWGAGAAAAAALALCTTSAPLGMLTPEDFSYVGSFKLQDRIGDTSDPGLGSSWGAITTRTDSGDGLTLLVTAWINGASRIFEYKVPDVGGMTNDLRTTATAALKRTFSDTTGAGYGYCGDFLAPNNCEGIMVTGISYVGNSFGNGHELILQYHASYYVNSWEPSVYSAILSEDEASPGGFATSTRYGPWCSRGDDVGVGGRDAFATTVPPGLAALAPGIAGKLLVGGDAIQVGAYLGFGANLFAFDHPRLTSRDVPTISMASASCSLRGNIPVVSYTVANPMPRPDVVALQGIACQQTDTNSCGCYDATGAFHQMSSGSSTWCKQLESSPQVLRMGRYPDVGPYRQTPSAYPPYWGGVTGGAVNVPIMDRMNSAVIIETAAGKSAVVFASNVVDTIPGYPYPDPLHLGNAASEVWYGGPFTFDGARGVWNATGNGATTLTGHLTAFSEADIASVVNGFVPPHGINPVWDLRKTQIGGYNPRGTSAGHGFPQTDVNGQSVDTYPDLVLNPYQFKMAYDPASQLLFLSRPDTWAYGPYEVVPTIDVFRVR